MVDYPIKIPPGSEDLLAGFTSGGRGRHCGPFFHGTNIYTFLLEIVTAFSAMHIEVWKSEDQGETWTQLDAANDPDIEGTSSTRHFDAQPTYDLDVVSRIYVLYTDTNGDFRVHPFNTTTDLWEPVGAAGTNPLSVSSMQMARRPTGVNQIEFPIAFNHTQDSGFNRVYLAVYRPATDDWTTPVRMFGTAIETEHYASKSRASGPATGVGQGRVHFFARQGLSDSTPGQTLVHRSVEINDTINSQEVVQATGEPKPGTAKDGSEIVIPYIGSLQDLKVARAISSSSMVWSNEDVLLGESELSNADIYNQNVVDVEGIMRAYYTRDNVSATQSDLYYIDDAGTGTWGDQNLVHSFIDPTLAILGPMNITAKGAVIGNVFNLEDDPDPEQAHYTQEGVLGPDAGMINQVDTVSGGGYVIA